MNDLCNAYFNEFLPPLLGRSLVDGLEELSTCFEVDIVDWPSRRRGLVIRGGALMEVLPEGYSPVATFVLKGETFSALIYGERSPIDAFLAQEIEITGDVEQGLALGPVLEQFFRIYRYPQ